MIAAAELGYRGADLWASVLLVHGETGWMAQADPDELIAILRILERRAQQLLPPDDASPILDALAQVESGCLAKKKSESDWDSVKVQANRVSSRLQKASSLLPMTESNALELGLQLGRIYHHVDDLPDASVRADVRTKVRAVLPEASDARIKAKFASARKLTSGYRWAMRIYALVDHELRFGL